MAYEADRTAEVAGPGSVSVAMVTERPAAIQHWEYGVRYELGAFWVGDPPATQHREVRVDDPAAAEHQATRVGHPAARCHFA
jgi:hypothetical protein